MATRAMLWAALLPVLLHGAPAAAEQALEWNEGMRAFFRSVAAQEIVLDVANADDHRWLAFQMFRLRYGAPTAAEAQRHVAGCEAMFGPGAWLAGLRRASGSVAASGASLLCVPAPERLATDLAWQRRVCGRAFHKRWNGQLSGNRFACKGQFTRTEIEALERQQPEPPLAIGPQASA